MIVRDGMRVLLGLRRGSHGQNTWGFVGGNLEFGESPLECAARELHEETGLSTDSFEVGPFTNDLFEAEERHYVTIFIVARYRGGEVQLREPDKCIEWRWFEWDALPSPLFLPIRNLLGQGFELPALAATSLDAAA